MSSGSWAMYQVNYTWLSLYLYSTVKSVSRVIKMLLFYNWNIKINGPSVLFTGWSHNLEHKKNGRFYQLNLFCALLLSASSLPILNSWAINICDIAWKSFFNWVPHFNVVQKFIRLKSHNECINSHFC